jgi:hypothetical protein
MVNFLAFIFGVQPARKAKTGTFLFANGTTFETGISLEQR